MKLRNVLSLFDGISCGQVALKRSNVEFENYYSSEIDKYAISVTQYNFPKTIQLGDVTNWKNWEIDWDKIDLLIGGSPCTNLSICGDRKGLAGEQSKLFFEYLEILKFLKSINPNIKYLLENVASMTKQNKEIITKYLKDVCEDTDVVLINSALVSAQQRKRLYWHNFGVEIEQPENKNIVLKDVLLSGCPYTEKAETLTARYGGACFPHDFLRHQRTQIAEPMCVNSKSGRGDNPNAQPSIQDRIYSVDGKSTSLTTCFQPNIAEPMHPNRIGGFYSQTTRWGIYDKNSNAPTLTASMGLGGGHIPMVADEINYKDKYVETNKDVSYNEKKLVKISDKIGYTPTAFNAFNEKEIKDKTPTLITSCSANGGRSTVSVFDPIKLGNIGSDSQAHRVYSVKGKSVTLSSGSGGQGGKTGLYKIDLPDGDYTIRKLTPVECERLQTLPDNYTALGIDKKGKEVKVSNAQRYKALGNGWTVDVISHIFNQWLK